MCESQTLCRTDFTTQGDSQPCRYSLICTNSSTPNKAKPISICSGGKTVRYNVHAARAAMWDARAPTNIALGANATGARDVSAPSSIDQDNETSTKGYKVRS